MKNYLDLWIAGLLRRNSARLQRGITIVGHREKHFGPRSEFARVVMTINPAEEFDVVDNVPCRKELGSLGVLLAGVQLGANACFCYVLFVLLQSSGFCLCECPRQNHAAR